MLALNTAEENYLNVGCSLYKQVGGCAAIRSLWPSPSLIRCSHLSDASVSARAPQSRQIHRSREIPEQMGSRSFTDAPRIRKRTILMRDLWRTIGRSKHRFTWNAASTPWQIPVLSMNSHTTEANLAGSATVTPGWREGPSCPSLFSRPGRNAAVGCCRRRLAALAPSYPGPAARERPPPSLSTGEALPHNSNPLAEDRQAAVFRSSSRPNGPLPGRSSLRIDLPNKPSRSAAPIGAPLSHPEYTLFFKRPSPYLTPSL